MSATVTSICTLQERQVNEYFEGRLSIRNSTTIGYSYWCLIKIKSVNMLYVTNINKAQTEKDKMLIFIMLIVELHHTGDKVQMALQLKLL
jgi:hypothetical protein